MTAIKTLNIDRGETYEYPFVYATKNQAGQVEPVDLSLGWSAQAQFREDYEAPALVSLSSEQGTITLTEAGQVRVILDPAVWGPHPAVESGVWDVILKSPLGRYKKPVKGTFTLAAGVTEWT